MEEQISHQLPKEKLVNDQRPSWRPNHARELRAIQAEKLEREHK